MHLSEAAQAMLLLSAAFRPELVVQSLHNRLAMWPPRRLDRAYQLRRQRSRQSWRLRLEKKIFLYIPPSRTSRSVPLRVSSRPARSDLERLPTHVQRKKCNIARTSPMLYGNLLVWRNSRGICRLRFEPRIQPSNSYVSQSWICRML